MTCYPGVDVVYYGSPSRLEYDLIAAPGADTSKVKFAIEGPAKITQTESGDIVVATGSGVLRIARSLATINRMQTEAERRSKAASSSRKTAPWWLEFRPGRWDSGSGQLRSQQDAVYRSDRPLDPVFDVFRRQRFEHGAAGPGAIFIVPGSGDAELILKPESISWRWTLQRRRTSPGLHTRTDLPSDGFLPACARWCQFSPVAESQRLRGKVRHHDAQYQEFAGLRDLHWR